MGSMMSGLSFSALFYQIRHRSEGQDVIAWRTQQRNGGLDRALVRIEPGPEVLLLETTGSRGWIAAETALATVVTMQAVSTSSPLGPVHVSQSPASAIVAPSARRQM